MFECLLDLIVEILIETAFCGAFEYIADKFSGSIANLFAFASFSAVKPNKKLTLSKSFIEKHYSKPNQENIK